MEDNNIIERILTMDDKNNFERVLNLKEGECCCLETMTEEVHKSLGKKEEFPAETVRRVFLEGIFMPSDLIRLRQVGEKRKRWFLNLLGLTETGDNRFIKKV